MSNETLFGIAIGVAISLVSAAFLRMTYCAGYNKRLAEERIGNKPLYELEDESEATDD